MRTDKTNQTIDMVNQTLRRFMKWIRPLSESRRLVLIIFRTIETKGGVRLLGKVLERNEKQRCWVVGARDRKEDRCCCGRLAWATLYQSQGSPDVCPWQSHVVGGI
eukprot:scaffold162_cov176-Amphora_coffeaeformis.AAC.21